MMPQRVHRVHHPFCLVVGCAVEVTMRVMDVDSQVVFQHGSDPEIVVVNDWHTMDPAEAGLHMKSWLLRIHPLAAGMKAQGEHDVRDN